MIQLRTDCLVFETSSGWVPCTAESFALEVAGGAAAFLDPEILRQAVAGVLRYFRDELGQEAVTAADFSAALARVLRGLGFEVHPAPVPPPATPLPMRAGFDLRRLAGASGTHFELGFFPLLRQELRQQLAGGPRVVHLTGLRACVKRLTATQRWCPRCRALHVQILAFLRQCLRESGVTECSLVVE